MRHRLHVSWVERLATSLGWTGGRPPTDFELLRAIYVRHDDDFHANSASRETRVYQPIDIPAIAKSLEATEDMVFGRLYHDLDQKYGERAEPEKARKAFFTPKAGSETHCVNWPLMVGVLARLWEERRRNFVTLGLSIASVVIALIALGVSIYAL
jgi:hypothetical protein